MKASANVFPKVIFNVAAAPATPASGNVIIYAKTGGGMFAKDSTGAETALSGGGGSGTVTSVALSVPGFLSVAGSPITTSGTLAVTLATQTANLVFAGPATGAAAAPTFRALVAADVSFALTNPMTAVGDMIVGGTAGAPTRVAIGANTYVWTSNGTTASWQASAGGGVTLSNTSAWTKNQYVALTTLTYASTVTPDASTSNNFALTMTGACTLANPTNLQTGMVLNFCIDQDSTGGRVITLGSLYKWPGGVTPTWITTASAKNFFSAYYDGTILRCNGGAGYA